MNYYRRHLPHWQPEEACYFVIFRLAESLPVELKKQLEQFSKIRHDNQKSDSKIPEMPFERCDNFFHLSEDLSDIPVTGPQWLNRPMVASIVQEAIHYRDNSVYKLYCYTIMPNHVHMIFQCHGNRLNTAFPVTKILQTLKGYTAFNANRILNRKGSFWLSESYDHVLRSLDEMRKSVIYILNNPVKAGLVKSWDKWPYSYYAPEIEEFVK